MNRNAYNNISYGLYILTSGDGSKANGCVINTFIQQATEPLTVSVTVNKSNYTCELIKKSGLFSVSCLDITADFEMFRNFGFVSGREKDKFAGVDGIATGPNGLPYLKKSTNAFFCCKVVKETDLGSHVQFLATVGACGVLSENDSLTYSYYHRNIKPAPQNLNKNGWRCSICNYVYEGDDIPSDFVCPTCKHPVQDFVKIG